MKMFEILCNVTVRLLSLYIDLMHPSAKKVLTIVVLYILIGVFSVHFNVILLIFSLALCQINTDSYFT